MKRLVAYSIIAAVFISLVSVAAYAEDVVIELSTSDGSSGLVIKNAAGVVVARIDSKGSFIQNDGPVVPPGAVMAFATEAPPASWLHCDGAAISRTDYADLFAAIGTMYGSGDGSSTFNLPDYRGKFLRAWDNGAGNDPDATNRLQRGDDPTKTGDLVGTLQADQLRVHGHSGSSSANGGHVHAVKSFNWGTGRGPAGALGNGAGTAYTSSAGSHAHTVYINSTGGAETRPKNITVLYCIKK